MLIGAAGKSAVRDIKPRFQQLASGDLLHKGILFEKDNLFIFFSDKDSALSGDKNSPVFIDGEIYSVNGRDDKLDAGKLYELYENQQDAMWAGINGDFTAAAWNRKENKLVLVRDRIGAGTLFFAEKDDGLVFSTSLKALAVVLDRTGEINYSTLLRYLVFCYNPGTETFFNGIKKIRPAHYLTWSDKGIKEKQYWDISFTNEIKSEKDAAVMIREELAKAVKLRLKEPDKTGAFLSGGLDSSSVVSLLDKNGAGRVSTFSFRCRGESFDESPFARIVADAFKTEHRVIEYTPESVLKAASMTTLMDEPFSDVGINIATYLLASEAGSKVKDIFTGDGGDELFAGHPVYIADKTAEIFSVIPDFILNPFFSMGRRLHDSEKKKDLKVKLKRFSESYFFPKELGTHRWRVYYQPGSLSDIVAGDIFNSADPDDVFKDVLSINSRAKAEDSLGRSLYSDYQTVVQFYLRRMDVVRGFGLVPRTPMLDPEIVSLCSKIDSKLKIKGFSDTKYIERVAVEPLLPFEITHRKDKLGHSVPLKNWMRDNKTVNGFIRDILSEARISRRGIVYYKAVEKMIREHELKQFNHSHRLWALVILELWLENVNKNWNKIGADK
ncbi:hypothetical protein J7K93_04145 [bacterium]|nr:hypothetical protein [bacterium]